MEIILNPKLSPISPGSGPIYSLGRDPKALFYEDITETTDLNPQARVTENIQGTLRHKNLLDYLRTCWANHYAPVITPDMVWYTILCELTGVIRENAEALRSLFSTADVKQEIIVQTLDPVRLPLASVLIELKRLVPTNIDVFLPSFSTSTDRSTFAFHAAFADAVSPYYSYVMKLCGFPKIIVLGTPEDWYRLWVAWEQMPQKLVLAMKGYWTAVTDTLFTLASENREDPELWNQLFRLEHCGSGHQEEVQGWVTRLFVTTPRLGYIRNFSSHVSKVDYKELTTGRKFSLLSGLFSSTLDAQGALHPSFDSVVFDRGVARQPREDLSGPNEIIFVRTAVDATRRSFDIKP